MLLTQIPLPGVVNPASDMIDSEFFTFKSFLREMTIYVPEFLTLVKMVKNSRFLKYSEFSSLGIRIRFKHFYRKQKFENAVI
jgi:hypothetical protein